MIAKLFEGKSVTLWIICAFPVFIALFSIFGPFLTDSFYLYSGVAFGVRGAILPGYPTIDPNFGETSFALGAHATSELFSGHLPLWNHYEGLGMPLLGEMESAALFPPAWLQGLPHGQAVEGALLQFVAGVGAFLFFRKFGLRTGAALAGSLAFEVNGVFAWLRAIANPVALLPWLFYAVEALRAAALTEKALSQRLPLICLCACAASLALYAGFPEQVYLCALLLISWAIFRAVGLPYRQTLTYVGDLLAAGMISLALSAPLLTAFIAHLAEADLGRHANNGFYGMWLDSGAIIQYIMPYIYGPIFARLDNQHLFRIWGNTGGYIGFVPIVFALAGTFIPRRRSVKVFLIGWTVIAVGATHGWPGLYQAFVALPLVKDAAFYRYLHPSWIFCIIFLSALFIDDVPTLRPPVLRRIVVYAVLSGLILIMLAALGAWPLIPDLWRVSLFDKAFIAASLLVVAAVSCAILAVPRYAGTRITLTIFSGLLAAEAVVWFMLPYLSAPREGRLDDDTISFLQRNVGYQRVVNTTGAALAPNYGSYFKVPLLNYDDNAAPIATVNYIKENLDPYAHSNVFVPFFPTLSPAKQADRENIFRERLSHYAKAGVKYVLARPDFDFIPAFSLVYSGSHAYDIGSGQWVEISTQADTSTPSPIEAISVLVGTYYNTSTGHLKVTVCADAACAGGVADLSRAEDNKPLLIPLDQPVRVKSGTQYVVRIEKLDGEKDVALWMFPRASTNATTTMLGTRSPLGDKYLPDIRLESKTDATLVHQGRSMSIFQLPGTRNYFSAEFCVLKALSHDRVDTSCARPSKLMRLEVNVRGWSATVDGRPSPISLSEGVFQTIDLPSGKARIEFSYEPSGFKPAMVAAGAALLLILTVFCWTSFEFLKQHNPSNLFV